jgi:hypothetical protein
MEADEQLKAELYQQIGQLQVEVDWLKKSPDFPVRAAADLDRIRPERADDRRPVPVGRGVAVGLLLCAGGRERREHPADASAGREVHADAVLWRPVTCPPARGKVVRAELSGRPALGGLSRRRNLPHAPISGICERRQRWLSVRTSMVMAVVGALATVTVSIVALVDGGNSSVLGVLIVPGALFICAFVLMRAFREFSG